MLRLLLLLFAMLAAPLAARPALAQPPAPDPIVASTQALDQAAKEYQAIDQAMNGRVDSSQSSSLSDRASTLRKSITDQVNTLSAQLALIDARVGQLGPVTPGVTEAPDIRVQRKLLGSQRSAADSAVKRGKLLGVETDQLIAEIGEDQANAFSEKMGQRVASPLTVAFWRPVFRLLPRDGRRLSGLFGAQAGALRSGIAQGGLWWALLGLCAALVVMVPVRMALRRIGQRFIIEHAPGSRLRRSAFALWLTVSGTLIPGVAALGAVQGLRAGGMLAADWDGPAKGFQMAAFISGLISALGGALLQRRQPSWRLVNLPDDAVVAMRPWTWAAAAVIFVTVMLDRVVAAAHVSDAAREAVDGAIASLHILLMAGILVAVGRRRVLRARERAQDEAEPPAATGLAVISLVAWAVVAAAIVALLGGYLVASLTISREMTWLPVVACTFYLLLISTDDICTELVARGSVFGRVLHSGFGVRGSLIDQAGVGLSALLRLALVLIGLSVAFAPFGSDVGSLFDAVAQLASGVTIGQVTISPGAILRSVAVLAVGMFLVRGVQNWLTERYLPTTELDAGARNSIAMVARYSGLILAALWSLTSLGIGIERIALLLSALSVGIGFGLQAITQNFVSGLILLAERPVKIGDWVRIGTDEGDVKRISVRSTEIQIGDKSTLIVPNSELITKTILNKTLSDPIGRIQLQFSVPMGVDVAQVRDMVLAIYADTPAILDDPAPSFFIDSLLDGRVNFNSFAYVRSPRDAYGTKSGILFRLLDEMPKKDIELGTTPQMVQWVGGGQPAAFASAAEAPPGSAGILDKTS
jgi:small-conductance mechanosensitive channel